MGMRARQIEADPWAGATWEGAESATLAAGARMTLAERLRWLEEATRVARRLATSAGRAEEIVEASDLPAPADRSRA